jgi:hypothetical protein
LALAQRAAPGTRRQNDAARCDPLYPRKQTLALHKSMFAKGQKQTQWLSFDHLVSAPD